MPTVLTRPSGPKHYIARYHATKYKAAEAAMRSEWADEICIAYHTNNIPVPLGMSCAPGLVQADLIAAKRNFHIQEFCDLVEPDLRHFYGIDYFDWR